MSEPELKIVDLIDGLPDPATNFQLVGHHDVWRGLVSRYNSGRMHHAQMLCGPRGIGKATLAFRFAGHVLRNPNPLNATGHSDGVHEPDDTDRKIAARSHPNLLHVKRPYDWKRKDYSTVVTVDEVRRASEFFAQSRGEPGWRVVIVDAVDEMNENAANALLKILEEPPAETLFLVIVHSLVNVPKTIRSRCQYLAAKPLSPADLKVVLDQFEVEYEGNGADFDLLAAISRGSVRRAVTILDNDGLELHHQFCEIAGRPGKPDWIKVHSLADRLVQRGREDQFRMFVDIAEHFLESRAVRTAPDTTTLDFLAQWVEVWEKMRQSLRIAGGYNLDKKQFILDLFHDMSKVGNSHG